MNIFLSKNIIVSLLSSPSYYPFFTQVVWLLINIMWLLTVANLTRARIARRQISLIMSIIKFKH